MLDHHDVVHGGGSAMKIIKLTAENVKRLKAVEITPDGAVQVITGRNAAGKSSVLDAIWLALGGGAAARETTRPIRDGEENASVTLDLGDLIVTRTWTGDRTSLTVKTADGAKYSSPQGVLDALTGRLSFDPLEFTRLSARDQRAALLDLVDLDVDLAKLAADRQMLYDRRTDHGRTVKVLEGQAKGLGPIEKAPDAEVSAAAIASDIRAVQVEAETQAADRRAVSRIEDDVTVLLAKRRRLLDEVRDTDSALALAGHQLDQAREVVAAHAPLPDSADLEAKLTAVEETNRAVRRNAERARVAEQLKTARSTYHDHSEAIEAIDRTKADALAKATFPVDGLGFDDTGVTYQGIPFAQASSAEQIRVSLAMAMSLNPKLRVIRIMDGSLLDADNLALITSMATDSDHQIWLEKIDDGSGIGVLIEDGAVVTR